MQNVVILGSTGSIGSNTLDVISQHLDQYNVVALSCNSQINKLLDQCLKYKPDYAVVLDKLAATELKHKLKLNNSKTSVLDGYSALAYIASLDYVDIVMSAIVGSSGLSPTLAAIKANKKVLLANKESLVASGQIMLNALNNSSASLIPVDSEHSAIFQCLTNNSHDCAKEQISRLILTASGGPFLHTPYEELINVNAIQAVKHPNWSMGAKISVDSSTLMNKGLELIEAYWLFGVPLKQIEVIIHPQSIIHSMVEYIDGSIIAQLGSPDMRCPISYALAYPQRILSGSAKLNFNQLSTLNFSAPDISRFPCLSLAYKALELGGSASAVLNAANEVAVSAFLNHQISFYAIYQLILDAIEKLSNNQSNTIEDILEIDHKTRIYVMGLINKNPKLYLNFHLNSPKVQN